MSDIPKTLKEIYISVLVHGNIIWSDGTRIFEAKGPRSFWEKLKILKPKVQKTYILASTNKRMKHADPDPGLARIQKIGWRFSPPKCKFMFCGRNIEFGYKYCEEHGEMCLCSVCKRKESTININGNGYCRDCPCDHEWDK